MEARDSGRATARSQKNPVLVQVVRGNAVESYHRGAAVIFDARNGTVAAWGDADAPVYPRSAVKPLQALPLLESGAADQFQLSDREIALACGSHSGERMHVQTVSAWLDKIGVPAEALACGAHPPYSPAAAAALLRDGEQETALHNNCSGKHLGFLTTALHMGEPLAGYTDSGHPVQQRVLETLSDMTGCDHARMSQGIDGCGIPVTATPLASIARAMARLAQPKGLPARRAAAARRIVAAMMKHPELVGGSGRFDTVAMSAARGAFIAKMGAEGVHVAAVPALGIAIALKIDDGAPRAAEVAMATLLRRIAPAAGMDPAVLDDLVEQPVMNCHGAVVGKTRPAETLAL